MKLPFRWVALLALTSTSPAFAQAGLSFSSTNSPFFYGGGLGATFGDVSSVDVAPMVGMFLNSRTSVGMTLLYRHRNDKRSTPALSTNDYGVNFFTRYHLTPNFFLEGHYEYLDYEYRSGNSTRRSDFSSVLAGGGISTPIGSNSSAYLSVLYNFTYDRQDSPYNDPLSVRFGIGFGF